MGGSPLCKYVCVYFPGSATIFFRYCSITTEDWNRIGFRPSISRLAIQLLQKFFSEKGKKFSMSVTSVCATIPKSLSSNDVKQQLFIHPYYKLYPPHHHLNFFVDKLLLLYQRASYRVDIQLELFEINSHRYIVVI